VGKKGESTSPPTVSKGGSPSPPMWGRTKKKKERGGGPLIPPYQGRGGTSSLVINEKYGEKEIRGKGGGLYYVLFEVVEERAAPLSHDLKNCRNGRGKRKRRLECLSGDDKKDRTGPVILRLFKKRRPEKIGWGVGWSIWR